MSVKGRNTAPNTPKKVTPIATHLPFILFEIDSLDTPAEYASKNVVVTVENTIIKSPAMPRPAFTKKQEHT